MLPCVDQFTWAAIACDGWTVWTYRSNGTGYEVDEREDIKR